MPFRRLLRARRGRDPQRPVVGRRPRTDLDHPDRQVRTMHLIEADLGVRHPGSHRFGGAWPVHDTDMVNNRAVTISQVADRAGVSTATVSRVLSGSAVVNAEMAQRVRKAADELGYRPNAAARGLATGSHQTIALVVPDLGNQYFNDVIKVINVLAHRHGQRIIVADSEGDPNT